MAIHLRSAGLVINDGGPGSERAMRVASHYTDSVVGYASVREGAIDDADNVLRSTTIEPTIGEALRLSGERDIPWVAMRRDFLPADLMLRDLIIGTGKAPTDEGTPGFAVLLCGSEPFEPYRRALAIVDRSTGPVSGFLSFVSVVLAEKAKVALDILVLGAEGEQLASEDEQDNVAVNRELDFYQEALDRARGIKDELDVTWITVEEPGDKWAVVADQITRGNYDLIIDEIGDVSVGGRLRRGIPIEDATGPGQVGELSLRLLEDVDTDLLLVIDAVRLGIQPGRLALLGAAAAAALTLVTGGAIALQSPTTEVAAAEATASADATAMLESLSASESEAAAAKKRAAAASDTSRSASKEAAAEEAPTPKAPKGGASKSDVTKAKEAQADSKAALDKANTKVDKAQEAAAQAKADLKAAQEEVNRAQAEIDAAHGVFERAVADAEATVSDASGLTGVLPGGATDEDAAAATQAAVDGQNWLDGAVARGEEALADLQKATDAVAETTAALAKAEEKAAAAQADYDQDKAKAQVYQESYDAAMKAKAEAEAKAKAEAAAKLAASRQSPLKSGTYNLSARYGQAGSAWSKGYHTGLDFAAPTGTNVYAAASGTVSSVGYDGAYGNRIVIDHGNGYFTTYNHLSNTDVSVGQRVTTGDKIGDVGNTGNSFGSHLHFEVTKGGDGWGSGSFVNPASWLGW